jgi:hypothetical protein
MRFILINSAKDYGINSLYTLLSTKIPEEKSSHDRSWDLDAPLTPHPIQLLSTYLFRSVLMVKMGLCTILLENVYD